MKKTNKKPRFVLTVLTILLFSIGFFVYFNQVEIAEATWWNESWSYRKALTINSDQVTGDLTNFPVLVSLTDTNLSTHAQEDGDDFVFVDNTGKKLSHEIESYASSTGVLVAWVKLPSLSSTVDTDIYMYYGNHGVPSQEDSENVWDENYVMVQHLNEEGTGTRYDSTANNNDGTTISYEGGEATTTAKINGADSFNGVDEWVEVADNDTLSFTDGSQNDSAFTMSAWVKFSTSTGASDSNTIVGKYIDNSPFLGEWSFSVIDASIGGTGSNKLSSQILSDGSLERLRFQSDDEVPLNVWSYVIFTYDGSETVGGGKLYLNANDVTAYTDEQGVYGGMNNFSGPVQIGASLTGYGSWDGYSEGVIDEVRISSVVRSSNWIQTEYSNQNNPSAFFSASAEEVGPGPVGYWSFNEGYGTVAHDESSSKNDGIISGAVWKNEEECVNGKCLYFDGTDDYIDTGFIKNLERWSLSVWVKSPAAPSDGGYINILYRDKNFNMHWDHLSSNFRGSASLMEGGTWYPSKFGNLQANTWYHLSATYDGETLVVYKDGIQASSNTGPSGDPDATSTSLLIGGQFETNDFFNGYIDEVKIYPYARTADQIKQDYNAGLSGVKSNSGTAVAFGSQSQNWISDGLVGYWKFDESATTSGAIDSSGNEGTGVYYGNASTTGGKFGNGGEFDGDGDYVVVSSGDLADDFPGKGSLAEFSFSYWAKYDSIGTNVSLRVGNRWQLDGSQFALVTSAGTVYLNYQSMTTGVWQNLAGVYDGEKMYLYVNGELDVEASQTGLINPASTDFSIGARADGTQSIDAKFDEVRFYSRALTPAEVKKLYEWAPGPVLHLKMDEKSGTSTYDSSGNENHAVLGGDGAGTDMPSRARGKYGSALEFDGTEDDMLVQDDASYDIGKSDLSISAWVKIGGLTGDRVIVHKGATSDNGSPGYNFYYRGTANDLLFGISDGTRIRADSDAINIEDEKWHHLAVSADRGSNAVFYVDGVSVGVYDISSAEGGDIDSGYMQIGVWNGMSAYFDGAIDDLRIYNYARTQKQILEDMNGCVETLHCNVSTKSPVLHLSFDEGQGEIVYDSSIYKNNGTAFVGTAGSQTATSSMWEKSGRVKGAMEFDGTDDYVDTNVSLDQTNFTVSAWFKTSDVSDYGMIVSKESFTGAPWNYRIYTNITTGYLTGDIHDGTNAASVSTNISVVDGDWHHAVFLRDVPKDTVYFYLDGELVGSANDTTTGAEQNSQEVWIGKSYYSAGGGYHFNGSIDEVKIWNYALSEDEIKEEYNSGASFVMGGKTEANDAGTTVTGASTEYCVPGDTATCTPPVLELKFDKKSGGMAYDTSGNGNDGTLMNMATSTNGGHVQGKYGGALMFDGIDDYVVLGDIHNISGDVTVEAWIKPSVWGSDGTIFRKGSAGLASYGIDIDNGSDFRFFRDTDGDHMLITSSVSGYNLNEWHHIVGVSDGTNGYLFVNGILKGTDIMSGTVDTSVRTLNIGVEQGTLKTDYFSGSIDGVKIYNYPRTPAQIAWDYNKGKPIVYWKFDECSGSVIHDESGNGNHGALNLGTSGVIATGTCASSSDSFWYNGRAGKKNSGGTFDGDDDNIQIPDMGPYDNFTVSAWVYRATNDNDTTYIGIVSKWSSGFGPEDEWVLGTSAGNYTYWLRTGDGTSVGMTPDVYFPKNEWVHVLMTYDGQVFKGYANAELLDSFNKVDTVNDGTHDVVIGSNANNDRYFEGIVDDVRIYNYALTEEQIKNVYNDGAVSFR